MASRNTLVKQIVNILRQVTSLEVVSDFLKSNGIKHSAGSWDAILNKRILPATKGKNPQLTISQLIGLLRDSEECGRQHTFLYKTTDDKAAQLLDSERLHAVLESMGVGHLLHAPLLLDQPEKLTFSDVRYEEESNSLIVKLIETRIRQKSLGEKIVGNILTKRYELKKERAVHVFKLHPDGLLELRIGSHSNSSDYKQDINHLWTLIAEIFPNSYFRDWSISALKDKLWEERGDLTDVVKFTNSTLRNDNGTVLQASCGSSDYDLIDDVGATSSLDEFMEYDAYCDASNIWFKQQENGIPSKDIHVLLPSARNEFAVTAHCARADYEYVLKKIRELNQ